VLVLGAVSLLNDLASEMVTPLIPVLLATLGAGPVALGVVEGVAESVAAFLKLASGRLSDWAGGRRKPLTVAGYALSNLVRPLLGVAGSWGRVVALRASDRVGKGIRSAPRDALIADSTDPTLQGRAFGLQRGLDHTGATLGSLTAAAVLAASSVGVRGVMLLSAIPGGLAVLLTAVGVREPRARSTARPELAPLRWSALSPALRRALPLVGVFAAARVSETFVVLRGSELGASPAALLLLWAALSSVKALSAWRGGRLTDRLGPRRTARLGWAAHGAGLVLLAAAGSLPALWAAALAYGLLVGPAEGAERALVAGQAMPAERGTAFGWYHVISGLVAVPAGLGFGVLWAAAGARTAFAVAAAVAGLAATALEPLPGERAAA
jgi:MFS family permease